jgi:periplasmic copper chaperone A
MMMKMPKKCIVALAALVLATACDRAPAVSVEDAVITLPALPGRPGAAYFALETNAPPERLVRIETDAAERIELHETMTRNGTTGMAPLASPAFDGDGRLEFAPGGRHAMLFGIRPGLKAGDRTRLTFTFDKAPPVAIEAEVRGPGQGHAGH